ncbi:neprilysin-11-like [Venturia canescens]|uniref:neprilysin-11-like n=1 Tax=Venturia canescens TaxID=32260 RepID=UPI001C9D247B|nr:neprilysin-11-like [Venturia canescens]
MLAQKISAWCILVAVISVANSVQASLLNKAVFPNDEKRPSSLTKHEFQDLAKGSEKVGEYEVCRTDGCKTIAKEFLSSINKTVDPCDDFYQFVCGGWTPEKVIPPSLPSWSRISMFQQVVNHRIKDILQTEPEPSDILPVRQAKKWYRSCMDTETLEERGLKPIESILLHAGGWPIAMDEEEWDADENDWEKVANSYTRLTGSHVFYDVIVSPPQRWQKFSKLQIKPQSPPLEEQVPLKYRNYSGNDYEDYRNFVAGVAAMFIEESRADVSEKKMMKDAEDIVEFEKNIYELAQDSNYWSEALEELAHWYKKEMNKSNVDPKAVMNWQSWVQDLFDSVNIEVDPMTEVDLTSSSYIIGMGKLLAETPKRTIVNYIHWHFVANMLSYTTEGARNALYRLLMEEYGIKESPPRWSECVADMKMIHASAYAFVEKYFTENTESSVKNMSKNIQRAMNEQIDASTWLDEESKTLAKDKLNSMKIFVGFPDWYKNRKLVTKFYKGLPIGNEYFDNVLSYQRYERKQLLKSYSYVPESDEESEPWFMDPITVNAVYGTEENSLNVPAANFQAPLFTPDIPDNVNYGIAGVTIGHEIGHGFDNTGIMFSKDGDETDLSEFILRSYYQRAECFINQFDKYYGYTGEPADTRTTGALFEEMFRHNRKSEWTRGENMADATGIQAVFEAYKKLEKSKKSVRLEGMEEFTDDQLFFVSFAASWCTIGTPEYEEKEKKSGDEHSPPNLRVIASVSNTKGFAEAFKCPAGSPMNPEDKCSVWGKLKKKKPDLKPAWMRRRPNRWGGQWRG